MAYIDIIANEGLHKESESLGFAPLILGKDVFVRGIEQKSKSPAIIDLASIVQERVMLSQVDFIKKIKQQNPIAVMHSEISVKKDFVHHRRSGLNHVILEALAEAGILLAIDLHQLRSAARPSQEQVLGRIMQNIRLARKAHARVVVFSFAHSDIDIAHKKDIEGMLRVLGMDPKDIMKAFLAEDEWKGLCRR